MCVHVMNNADTMQYITQCPSTRNVITTFLSTNNYLLSQIVKEQPIDVTSDPDPEGATPERSTNQPRIAATLIAAS